MSSFILVRFLSDTEGTGVAGGSNSVVRSVCPKNWKKPIMVEGIRLILDMYIYVFIFFFVIFLLLRVLLSNSVGDQQEL